MKELIESVLQKAEEKIDEEYSEDTVAENVDNSTDESSSDVVSEEDEKEDDDDVDSEEDKKDGDDDQDEEDEDDNKEEVKESISFADAKGQLLDSLKESDLDIDGDLSKIFSGVELDEEFMKKVKLVYESTLHAHLSKAMDVMFEAINESADEVIVEAIKSLEEEKEAYIAKLDEDVAGYMQYVSEQWLEENQVAVERNIRTELAEAFITDMKNLMERHSIHIEDGSEDIVASLTERCEQLEEQLNEAADQVVTLYNENKEMRKTDLIESVASGLTIVEKDKFMRLSEAVDFDNEDQFQSDLITIKESYFDSEPEVVRASLEDVDGFEVSLEEDAGGVNVISEDYDINSIAKALKGFKV